MNNKKSIGLTRFFTGDEIKIGIRAGVVSREVLFGQRPGSFDERLKLEAFLSEHESKLGLKKN